MKSRISRLSLGEWIGVAVLAVAVALPLRGLLRYAGPPMEEGFMLVFPERLLRGDVPNVDFLHLYGPGSLYALGAIYKLFGAGLTVERLAGLAQELAIVAAIFWTTRRWGAVLATTSALIAVVLVLTPTGLTALAWDGGVALGLWAVVLAANTVIGLNAAADADALTTGVRRRLLAAGVLAGLALSFRPDLIIAVGLGAAALWWLSSRRVLQRLGVGLVVGLVPILIHLGMAGPFHSLNGMVLDPVFRLRDGRALPRPPSWNVLDGALQKAGAIRPFAWPLPTIGLPHQVFLFFFILIFSTLFVAAVGLWRARTDRRDPRAIALCACGAFGLGLLPQALQRPDTTHLAWVGAVTIALVPVATYELLTALARRLDRHQRTTATEAAPEAVASNGDRLGRWITALSVMVVPLMLAVAVPSYTLLSYGDVVGQSIGVREHSYAVVRGDRRFYLGTSEAQQASQALIADLDRLAKPGQRLFVGTEDLRRTPYSDAFFYYLYPELRPGTYYIEMDPGMANRPDSGLADDLANSDFVILSGFWRVWVEPNASQQDGSDEPNQVLRDHFCQVGTYGGLLSLYQRCDHTP